MNYKKIAVICLAVTTVVIFCIRLSGHLTEDKSALDPEAGKTTEISSTGKNANGNGSDGNGQAVSEPHISRAHALKMLTLLRYSHDEIELLPRTISYTDTTEDKWFDKYINAAASMGIILGVQECSPTADMTYGDCGLILEQLTGDSGGTVAAAVALRQDGALPADAITIDKWLELYSALDTGEIISVPGFSFTMRSLKSESVFLMSIIEDKKNNVNNDEISDENNNGLNDDSVNDEVVKTWEVATSSGAYHFDGFAIDAYTNTTLNILSDGNEIIHIYGTSDSDTVLKNAWICDSNEDEITLFYAGSQTTFTRGEDCTGEAARNTIADITVSGGTIVNATSKGERVTDKILAVTDSYIETLQYGRLPLAPSYRIYGLYDGVARMNMDSILVGYSATELVVYNGDVCAMLVTSQVQPDMIRVALMTDKHAGYYHKKAEIRSDMGMTVSCAGNQAVVAAGESLELEPGNDLLAAGRVTITPAEGGRLLIPSIKRSARNLFYRGSLELTLNEEGILLINELPIEEYLYSVVPSEMPVSYGLEPLKVQAICARSYAYMQVMSNALAVYGAHVNDSTAYQVYNNISETAESIEAVDQTAGQLLTYNGKVIPTYYFSTSCGHTSSGSDVWLGMKNTPYLRGKLQEAETVMPDAAAPNATDSTTADDSPSDKYDDLSDETVFRSFLNDGDFKTYDSGFPWYRWNLKLSSDDVKKAIEASIATRYSVNPSLILTRKNDGSYISEPVESIGKVRKIKVEKRSSGGIVTALVIKGSEKTIKILSEYNIRLLLAPVNAHIARNDGSTVDGLALLPSAFVCIDTEETDGKQSFVIKGGGYGHGVGMSQNGAKAMAEAGASYEEILSHYYEGCALTPH